jgi:hypothetical protein
MRYVVGNTSSRPTTLLFEATRSELRCGSYEPTKVSRLKGLSFGGSGLFWIGLDFAEDVLMQQTRRRRRRAACS